MSAETSVSITVQVRAVCFKDLAVKGHRWVSGLSPVEPVAGMEPRGGGEPLRGKLICAGKGQEYPATANRCSCGGLLAASTSSVF